MAKDPCRVGFYLHLTCKKHNEKTFIKGENDIVQSLSSVWFHLLIFQQNQKISIVSTEVVLSHAERKCHVGMYVC